MTDITPLSADALATLVEDFEASDERGHRGWHQQGGTQL